MISNAAPDENDGFLPHLVLLLIHIPVTVDTHTATNRTLIAIVTTMVTEKHDIRSPTASMHERIIGALGCYTHEYLCTAGLLGVVSSECLETSLLASSSSEVSNSGTNGRSRDLS